MGMAVTLIGLIRGKMMNLYTSPKRVLIGKG